MYLQKELRDKEEGKGEWEKQGLGACCRGSEPWRVVPYLHAQSLFTLHQAAAKNTENKRKVRTRL